LQQCGHQIGLKGFGSKAAIDQLFKPYLNTAGEARIKTANLKVSDPFVKDLAHSDSYFSIKTLESVIKVRSAHIAKAQRAEASLDEILKR
jgi:hypothetical protein